MNHAATDPATTDPAAQATQALVVEEDFPHAPALIWQVLTAGEMIGRWLMAPVGFEPIVGKRFTFHTKPADEWDGTIDCEVVEVMANKRLAYAWRGGHKANVGHGSLLDTLVTWTLTPLDTGTRLRLEHAGFFTPKNNSAFNSMGQGWKTVVPRLGAMCDTET